jgi:hypothetical protein
MRALPALVAVLIVLALGAEAAQAGMTLKVDIWGAGKVELPSERFTCASTNRNDRELGTTCTLTSDLLIAALTATPDASQPVTWRFSSWQGDCFPFTSSPPNVCFVSGAPFAHPTRTVSAKFDDDRPPAVTLSGGPVGTVHDESASFDFTSDEPGGTFLCKLVDEDAFTLCPSGSVSYKNLSRGQHIFEVMARDPSGNDSPPQQRYWTVDFDRDGDRYDHAGPGARDPIDCDDASASIYPGAREAPENKIDEDCDGKDAAYPAITSVVHYVSKSRRRVATFTRLSVIRPPEGALVVLRCRGTGCRFAGLRRKADPGTSKLAFGRDLRKTKLRRGAVLELRITHAGMRGKVVRLKVGRRGSVTATTLCLKPGGQRPTSCSAR